ncbi:hypothetical protein SO802_001396 [Lithocarpus litseifolius]|uniref:Uncharacterized protein n=1 Tax=Lithocarpus litseifolius TaxID=425828 RepID=A0AAW2DWY6_9ROSI
MGDTDSSPIHRLQRHGPLKMNPSVFQTRLWYPLEATDDLESSRTISLSISDSEPEPELPISDSNSRRISLVAASGMEDSSPEPHGYEMSGRWSEERLVLGYEKCRSAIFLAVFMWRRPLNSAALATTTHKKPKRVSDVTGTQVRAQMINKCRIEMDSQWLYNVQKS